MSQDLSPLANFKGVARLFPLPNLVLFPHVVQPLHIFESRYRDMTANALAGDRLIAVVLLRPGWEADYEGRPAIHPVACLGKIVADQRLADGRYNILLRGLSRVRLVKEVCGGKPYRSARVQLLTDTNLPDASEEFALRRRLAELAGLWFQGQPAIVGHLGKLFASDLDLSTLCDVFSFALPLEAEFKQELLETLDVAERLSRLVERLESATPPTPPTSTPEAEPVAESVTADRKFPPDFSEN
jgi:uncharacterized protein